MGDSDNDEWSEADEDELANIDFPGESYTISKYSMKCDQLLEAEGTPLQRYRPTYLKVSDFVNQHWCEQKLLYGLSPEAYLINTFPGAEVNIEESAAVKEVKGKGSDIHQTRELEIQVPVEVPVITREDIWAVKFLNIQTMIQAFHNGHSVAREVPVFGVPFGSGLFVYGVIDEIQYNPDLHTIEILELKTRKSCIPPRTSQQDKDRYQMQSFTCITEGTVEYVHQDSKIHICSVKIILEPERMQLEFARHCEWWQGERGTSGVDIEDCWKCNFCQFAPLCEWLAVKASESKRGSIKK